MGIFACTEKKYTHTARCSHFVFRNNTVCSGKRRGFPVIYRQSDEVRQTNPSNYFFPSHFSPFGRFSSPRPSLSRLRIGCQKRNGVKPFRFWRPAGERRMIPVTEKPLPPAHYSQFVFRNNTVCSGKRRGFPVIYRQSDEARQTEPPIISFPLISPLSWAIVQPAAGSLSRRQIGWQKRNGDQPFRFSDCQKSLAEFAPAGANKVPSIFAGGMYVGKNTSRLANVRA